MTRLRVVSPYRPFAPESSAHRLLGPFDWVGALRMLQASVERHGYDFAAITDTTTALSVPSIALPTTATRLMLWILDVSVRYLESEAFDRDSVMVSPDSLVMGDLRPYFAGDLSILVRTHRKYTNRPILNGAQWWPVRSKDKLIGFYRETLAIAQQLPENLITWGADSESLRMMLEPVAVGVHHRHGLQVSMLEARSVMVPSPHSRRPVSAPIIDFKYLRKQSMATYFDAVMPSMVTR